MTRERDDKTFTYAFAKARNAAANTGARYYVLLPEVMNKGMGRDMVFLNVPIIHEDHASKEEIERIAFIVYPSGNVECVCRD